ncbi:MAG: hypothetical protein IPH75_07220 [bacterium]|nr:hypothetical protein [bacterium]
MIQEVSVGECLSEGWEYYKRNFWLTIGTLVIYLVIAIIGGLIGMIPFIGFLFSLLVAPVFGSGLYLLFLNVARDSNPRIEDLFAGFNRYGTIIGMNFLYMGIFIIGMLPTIIYGFTVFIKIFNNEIGPENFPWSLFLVAFLNGMLLIFGLVRYWLTYFVIMDDPRRRLFDALQRSADITKYNSHNVILLAIASWFIMVALFIALIIPALIFGPFLFVAFGRMYVKLSAMHPEAITQPGVPPETPPMTM